jgi:hypothetical protein
MPRKRAWTEGELIKGASLRLGWLPPFMGEQMMVTCLCGRAVLVGRTKEGRPVLIHQLPTCEHYDNLETAEGMHFFRLALALAQSLRKRKKR